MAEPIPSRHGRMAGERDWKKAYAALRMTAEEAAELVRDGDVLDVTGGANWPNAFDAALARNLKKTGKRIELNTLFMLQPYALTAPELQKQVCYNTGFLAARERELHVQGNVHFCPINLGQTGRWMAARRPRIVAAVCSAPDENGWMSRGMWGAHVTREAMEQCEVLLAVVNDRMPSFVSDGERHMLLHVSEVDGILEDCHAPLETPPAPADETDRAIAGHIAELVSDGSCVQFGLGGLANAVGSDLVYAGKKDLGLQSEAITDCVVDLMRRGVINNSRKQICRGRSVGAYYIGDRALWDFAGGNPDFCQKEIDWVNDPRRICRNDAVVSINNAMEIDLTGQVNAESIGDSQYSGSGGQLEWVIGSQWSKGGKSIIALRSAYRDSRGQLHSKIKPTLPPGSIVTTPRSWTQYVVTEYGVADLRYRSVLERARALIAVAHPDFREELRRQMPW